MSYRAHDRGGSDWGTAWFQVDTMPDCVVVTAAGEIDMSTSPGLDRAVEESLRSAPCLVIDLTRVEFMDSSGLGALLEARNQAREHGGSMLLVHPPEVVRNLLVRTQLQQTFTVYDTVDEATAAIRTR
jgi:anti-sigma B factor antagonist